MFTLLVPILAYILVYNAVEPAKPVEPIRPSIVTKDCFVSARILVETEAHEVPEGEAAYFHERYADYIDAQGLNELAEMITRWANEQDDVGPEAQWVKRCL
jgi:hypothetical protein